MVGLDDPTVGSSHCGDSVKIAGRSQTQQCCLCLSMCKLDTLPSTPPSYLEESASQEWELCWAGQNTAEVGGSWGSSTLATEPPQPLRHLPLDGQRNGRVKVRKILVDSHPIPCAPWRMNSPPGEEIDSRDPHWGCPCFPPKPPPATLTQ